MKISQFKELAAGATDVAFMCNSPTPVELIFCHGTKITKRFKTKPSPAKVRAVIFKQLQNENEK